MPFVNHKNGERTHYLVDDFTDPWKPHKVILIQHGFARHSGFWYKWVPLLAQHYRVIRRDARGHGHSSAPGSGYRYSVDTILEEILDTLNQLGIDKVHWLGESTGGIWGEFMAARHPERLHSLAICSSPLYMPAAAQEMLAFGHGSWAEACRQMGSRGWGEALARQVLATDQISDTDFLNWWLDEVAVADGKGLGDHAELLCDRSFDARHVMADIKVPMLLLSPADSKLVNLDEQKLLNTTVPGSRMEVIAGHGHEIYINQAGQCLEKYLAFLRGVER